MNESLQAALTRIERSKRQFTSDDLSMMSTYLFCSLVSRNWQRLGAAITLTFDEAVEAAERDGHLVVHSRQHKTTLTYGPAVMVIHEVAPAMM